MIRRGAFINEDEVRNLADCLDWKGVNVISDDGSDGVAAAQLLNRWIC